MSIHNKELRKAQTAPDTKGTTSTSCDICEDRQRAGIRQQISKSTKSTIHPRGHTRCSETTHVLQAGAAHGEIADEVPDEGSELEDGGDESEEEALKLQRTKKRSQSARVSRRGCVAKCSKWMVCSCDMQVKQEDRVVRNGKT
jgi:hypothetical protein